MADTGLLAHEYEQSAQMAREFTQAVLAIKKQHYKLPGAASLDTQEVAAWRRRIAELLLALRDALTQKGVAQGLAEKRQVVVPYPLVNRIERNKRGVLPRFLEDIEGVAVHLQLDAPALAERDIGLLDEIGQMLDAETSAAFRKLMRR